MRRILGFRSFVRTVKFDFCKVESEPSFASDTMDKSLNSLDQEQIQTNANEYKLGMHYMNQGKYRLALEFFKRVQVYLDKNQLKNAYYWDRVQKKIAFSYNQLRRYEDCEKTLESIIENYQKQKASEALIYGAYNNLFVHCLRTNLQKAILLGKALLSNKEKDLIPIAYVKQFTFNLGTAYLLKENYVDAKARLRECLMSDPNSMLRGQALNNLAVACWWHKYPNLREFLSDEEEMGETLKTQQNYDNIDNDFLNVIPLLKRSINSVESSSNEENKDPTYVNQLESLVDENVIIPTNHKEIQQAGVLLKQKICGTPLLNITEFIFNTQPQKREEAQFWFKYTMKFFEKNDPNNIDRSIILLAWLCSSSKQYERAEILFRNTLKMLENSDTYNKVLCMQLLGTMLKKKAEHEEEGRSKVEDIFYYIRFDCSSLLDSRIASLLVEQIGSCSDS